MPRKKAHNFLRGARVYLSGPMDFVASRSYEKRYGWRVRIKQFLERYGVTVFDPWNKPEVRGMMEYGREDATTIQKRDSWTFKKGQAASLARAKLSEYFWETMHIDLRMVDISDFLIAYAPTNIYSVGTVHEIVTARAQRKPVLFISPPFEYPALKQLEEAVKDIPKAEKLLRELRQELTIKENVNGTPSLWYMPLIGSESFFDGFGFHGANYFRRFPSWKQETPLDKRELVKPPEQPLMPFLEALVQGKTVPRRWSHAKQAYEPNDDWLLLEQSLSK